MTNLRLLCKTCNNTKSDRREATAEPIAAGTDSSAHRFPKRERVHRRILASSD
ncbi:hypothetical protein ACF1GW_06760 [Streptomyces achromogenes]|uniref:hypothetical protein n=1 Tax=Streptomyces achromogenes TaxID=67255 RepID=UPI0036F94FD1